MANTFIVAGVLGVLPVLAWVWFWLRYDREYPEPKGLLCIAFLLGMASIPLVIPLERWVLEQAFSIDTTILLNAGIEEIFKFALVAVFTFTSRYLDEPIDYAMYLITGAMGFAALENIMFLIGPAEEQNIALTIATGNLRFMGATVLHGLSAAIIGIALAYSFYGSFAQKLFHGFVGVMGAITLHALFNFFIIRSTQESIGVILALLWCIVLVIVYLFSRLSYLHNPPQTYGKEFS